MFPRFFILTTTLFFSFKVKSSFSCEYQENAKYFEYYRAVCSPKKSERDEIFRQSSKRIWSLLEKTIQEGDYSSLYQSLKVYTNERGYSGIKEFSLKDLKEFQSIKEFKNSKFLKDVKLNEKLNRISTELYQMDLDSKSEINSNYKKLLMLTPKITEEIIPLLGKRYTRFPGLFFEAANKYCQLEDEKKPFCLNWKLKAFQTQYNEFSGEVGEQSHYKMIVDYISEKYFIKFLTYSQVKFESMEGVKKIHAELSSIRDSFFYSTDYETLLYYYFDFIYRTHLFHQNLSAEYESEIKSLNIFLENIKSKVFDVVKKHFLKDASSGSLQRLSKELEKLKIYDFKLPSNVVLRKGINFQGLSLLSAGTLKDESQSSIFGHIGNYFFQNATFYHKLSSIKENHEYIVLYPTYINLFQSNKYMLFETLAHEISHKFSWIISRLSHKGIFPNQQELYKCLSSVESISVTLSQAEEAIPDWIAAEAVALESKNKTEVIYSSVQSYCKMIDSYIENCTFHEMEGSHPNSILRLAGILGAQPEVEKVIGMSSGAKYCSP